MLREISQLQNKANSCTPFLPSLGMFKRLNSGGIFYAYDDRFQQQFQFRHFGAYTKVTRLVSLSDRTLWWSAAALSVVFGMGWAICLLLIPLLIAGLTDPNGGAQTVLLSQFLVVSSLAIFSQAIIDKIGSMVRRLWGPHGGLESLRDELKRNLIAVCLSIAGLILAVTYFVALRGHIYKLQDDTTFELQDSGIVMASQIAIVIIMLVLGTIQSWKHPWFRPTSGVAVG